MTTNIATKKKKVKLKQSTHENLVESFGGIASGIGQQAKDSVKEMISVEKILGFGIEHSGELSEGEELNLKELHGKNQEETKEKADIEPGIEYSREIVHVGERAVNRENTEIEAQLRELMEEIKKLTDSSKVLQMEFKEFAVEQHAIKPGKYHKSFFSWLLTVVRNARMKVEDSGAWLSAMHSKKKSREYGAMAKKHGTTFTLNNERNVATQVG